jgi:hypothetical protein
MYKSCMLKMSSSLSTDVATVRKDERDPLEGLEVEREAAERRLHEESELPRRLDRKEVALSMLKTKVVRSCPD